jgi:hypothetical protein
MTKMTIHNLTIRSKRVSGDDDGEQPRPGPQRSTPAPRSYRRRMRIDDDNEDGEQPRG